MAPSSVLFKLLVSILVIKTLFHFIYSVTATYKLLARVSSDFPLSGSIIPITFYVRYYHLHQLQDSDCSRSYTWEHFIFSGRCANRGPPRSRNPEEFNWDKEQGKCEG